MYRPLAVTLHDPELARDAAAEGMARAFRRWSSVARYDNPAGWVYRVGLNWARSHLRRSAREVSGRQTDRPVEQPDPADPALGHALSVLPIEFRSVLVLRYLEDWSQEQIAAALRLPVGTVKSRLHRGLARLRKELT